MKFYFWSVFFLACSVGVTNAGPSSGTLIGNTDQDVLNYECKELGGNSDKITCSFVQVLLRKKTTPEELASNLADLDREFDAEEITDLQSMMCSMSEHLNAIITGNVDTPIEGIDPTDLVRAHKDYKSAHPKNQANLTKMASDAHSICDNPNREAFVKLFTNIHKQDSRTCRVLVNKYTQTYVRISDTLWAVESTPSGTCGVVNTSKFIGLDQHSTLWEHETSQVVMNKEGGGLLSCADLDESKDLYTWRGGQQYLGCEFIE